MKRYLAEGDRRRRYQVAWEALFTAYRQTEAAGRTVIGVFHSHPDGTDSPSDIDTREALDDFLYIIVPVREGIAGWPRACCFADGGFVPGDLVYTSPDHEVYGSADSACALRA